MGKNGEFILWGIGKTDWEIPHFSPLFPIGSPPTVLYKQPISPVFFIPLLFLSTGIRTGTRFRSGFLDTALVAYSPKYNVHGAKATTAVDLSHVVDLMKGFRNSCLWRVVV